MLLFLVWFNNSNQFQIYGVTRSYSSRPFLYALAWSMKFIVRTIHVSGGSKQASIHMHVSMGLTQTHSDLASNTWENKIKWNKETDIQSHLTLQTVTLSEWPRELSQGWCMCMPRDHSVEFGEIQHHCATFSHLAMSGKRGGGKRVSELKIRSLRLPFTHISSNRWALIRICLISKQVHKASTQGS